MLVAATVFGTGLLFSCGLMFFVLHSVPKYWKGQAQYATERLEKACDAVTSFVAFLIPVTLAVTTWVYEKTETTWYGALLALSTIWFLLVLGFTMYVRFNLVWGLPEKVTVGAGQNMRVVQWLTSVMVGLTVGLIFLAIPTFFIAFQSHATAEGSISGAHYEYHINEVKPGAPCPAPQPAGQELRKAPRSSQKPVKEE